MERPIFKEETINRQNDMYASDVNARFADKPKNGSILLRAVTEAFILGAGGYEGSFDAALVLEAGGMAVLLDSLGLSDIDSDQSREVDPNAFSEAVRSAVDFGAHFDLLEDEISDGAITDGELLGRSPLDGPLTRMFHIPLDGRPREPWLSE